MKKRNFAVKALVLMLVIAVMMPAMAAGAFAATKVSVDCADEQTAGSEFDVKIRFSGDSTAKVEGQIGFDPSKLEYVSGGEDGGEGYVILKKGGGDGSVTFNVTFRAIKGGNTGIDVSSSMITDVNKNEIDNCAETKVIHISGDSNAEDENVVDETEAAPDEGDTAGNSNDMYLYILAGIVLAAIIAVIAVIAGNRKRNKTDKRGRK